MSLLLYFHTIRYIKLIQILTRLKYLFFHPKPDFAPAPETQNLKKSGIFFPKKNCICLKGENRFRFLNSEREIVFPQAWNDTTIEKLWLYNLHYFDFLLDKDSERKVELLDDLMRRWIKENPPPNGIGWETYTISIRIVNWIKWVINGNTFSNDALQSLAVQARYLTKRLETHLLGNHLFENAKALIFTGLYFKGHEAERWLQTGITILKEQIPEQILSDGGHFERSPMYHSIILEDLLDIFNIMRIYGKEEFFIWNKELLRMYHWLRNMCHPDREIVLFNDAAFGIARSPDELETYVIESGFPAITPPGNDLVHLPESGYVRIKKRNTHAFLDIAPIGPDYQPGHGHADTLTFELSINRQRVFVDSGTSCYENCSTRLYQRGTSSHNTVVVDKQNSSQVWNSFRVARRAGISDIITVNDADGYSVSAAHNGYSRLKNVGKHFRTWHFNDEILDITDKIMGHGIHHIQILFHLHPDIKPILHDTHSIELQNATGETVSTIHFDTSLHVVIEQSTYYPEFGLSLKNKKIVGQWEGELPACFKQTIMID